MGNTLVDLVMVRNVRELYGVDLWVCAGRM